MGRWRGYRRSATPAGWYVDGTHRYLFGCRGQMRNGLNVQGWPAQAWLLIGHTVDDVVGLRGCNGAYLSVMEQPAYGAEDRNWNGDSQYDDPGNDLPRETAGDSCSVSSPGVVVASVGFASFHGLQPLLVQRQSLGQGPGRYGIGDA